MPAQRYICCAHAAFPAPVSSNDKVESNKVFFIGTPDAQEGRRTVYQYAAKGQKHKASTPTTSRDNKKGRHLPSFFGHKL
jgi:hypothetical protein